MMHVFLGVSYELVRVITSLPKMIHVFLVVSYELVRVITSLPADDPCVSGCEL